ncbi:MAG: hypothetical protein V4544_06340 [Pseudomonadota bacterium]
MNFQDKITFIFLCSIGIMQLSGDLLNVPLLKALGAATGASPAPKVFTAQNGFETYTSTFYISWSDQKKQQQTLELSPKIYKGIKGPYNRRNAYGAIISYAPVLYANSKTKDMFLGALHYSFCGKTTVLGELGICPDKDALITLHLSPKQKLPDNHTWKLQYEVKCHA